MCCACGGGTGGSDGDTNPDVEDDNDTNSEEDDTMPAEDNQDEDGECMDNGQWQDE